MVTSASSLMAIPGKRYSCPNIAYVSSASHSDDDDD